MSFVFAIVHCYCVPVFIMLWCSFTLYKEVIHSEMHRVFTPNAAQSHVRASKQCFYSKDRIAVWVLVWFKCSFLFLSPSLFTHAPLLLLSLPPSVLCCFFLTLDHTQTRVHTRTYSHAYTHCFSLSPSLLSVQLASGLHFPLEPVEGGALLCELV